MGATVFQHPYLFVVIPLLLTFVGVEEWEKGRGIAIVRAVSRSPITSFNKEGLVIGPTIGALLVAYRQPKAFLNTLRSYRAAYPEGDLVVACDNGCFNYTAACAHFNATFLATPRRIVAKTHVGWFMEHPEVVAYAQLLREALPHIHSRWVFHLETDVVIEQRVMSDLNFTLNGALPVANAWFTGGERAFAVLLNPSFREAWGSGAGFDVSEPHPPYGGQGGAILDRDFWWRIVNQPSEHLANDLRAYGSCSIAAGVDYFYTALTYRYNGTVGPYAGLFFTGLTDQVYHSLIEVVHPDKWLYDQPLEASDLDVLGPNYATPLKATGIHSEPDFIEGGCRVLPNVTYQLGGTGLAST